MNKVYTTKNSTKNQKTSEGSLISWEKNVTIVLYVAGILPFGFIISLLTFYFHTRAILGRFPTYNNPDPILLDDYTFYNGIIDPAIRVWLLSFLVWSFIAAGFRLVTGKRFYWKHLLFSSIGHIIALIITFSDIFEWYVD